MESDDSILEKVRKMNTRSIAMIAILAVAAVAVVGAGYAYYWGQTTINDNTADVEYIAVSTDMTKLDAVTVDFNTTSTGNITTQSYTLDVSGSKFVTIDGKNVTPITKKAGTAEQLQASVTGLALGQKMVLKADKKVAANGYDFQVVIDKVTLGSNAQLYFMVASEAEPTSVDGLKLNKFVSTGTTGEYVANIPGQAIEKSESSAYTSEFFYGFIFLGETDSNPTTPGIQVADVATAKASFGDRSATTPTKSTITFQAMINKVTSASIAGTTITVADESGLDGFALTSSDNGAAPTAVEGTTITATAGHDYCLIYKQGADVFYEVFVVPSA
jgi:hypothetical protein